MILLVRLAVHLLFCVPSFGLNLFVQVIPRFKPLHSVRTGEIAFFRKAQSTIECDPHHDFGVEVMLLFTSDFPDTQIGFIDLSADIIHNLSNCKPALPAERFAKFLSEVDTVEEFAVNVQLQVIDGTVADADGLAVFVSREMIELFFRQVFAAVNRIHARKKALGEVAPTDVNGLAHICNDPSDSLSLSLSKINSINAFASSVKPKRINA